MASKTEIIHSRSMRLATLARHITDLYERVEERLSVEGDRHLIGRPPYSYYISRGNFKSWVLSAKPFAFGHKSLDWRLRDRPDKYEITQTALVGLDQTLKEFIVCLDTVYYFTMPKPFLPHATMGDPKAMKVTDEESSKPQKDMEWSVKRALHLTSIPERRSVDMYSKENPEPYIWELSKAMSDFTEKLKLCTTRTAETTLAVRSNGSLAPLIHQDYRYDHDMVTLAFEWYRSRVPEDRRISVVDQFPKAEREATARDELSSPCQVWCQHKPPRMVKDNSGDKKWDEAKAQSTFILHALAHINNFRRQQFEFWNARQGQAQGSTELVPSETRQPIQWQRWDWSRIAKILDLSKQIEIPPPPIPSHQQHFECPYCFIICDKQMQSEEKWREHVMHDLGAYVCTYPNCTSYSWAQFGSIEAWEQHEKDKHSMTFRCHDHDDQFPDRETYERHVENTHGKYSASGWHRIANPRCTRKYRPCPICFDELTGPETPESHLARHLERLALLTLPGIFEKLS